MRVLSEFYIVNTLPDLAPLPDAAFAGLARDAFGSPHPRALHGDCPGAFLLLRLEKTGRNNPHRREPSLTGRESRARQIPQFSLLPFCFLPFQPQNSSDRSFISPYGEGGTAKIPFPFFFTLFLLFFFLISFLFSLMPKNPRSFG